MCGWASRSYDLGALHAPCTLYMQGARLEVPCSSSGVHVGHSPGAAPHHQTPPP